MTDDDRTRFDALMDDAVESLPPRVASLLEEIAVVVLDEPTAEMLKDLGIEPGDREALDEMCGLHTGTALTERSVEAGELPTTIHVFRRGIVTLAGGWEEPNADERVYEEIRITLLHEIGHHFGLDEGDLEALGYD
jgi:predicted Zn-dependent protease with MMP-like domain